MFETLQNLPENLKTSIVIAEMANFKGEDCLSLRFEPSQVIADAPNFAYFASDFHNGTIEVELAGTIEENAPEFARGFIGVAFRIAENLSPFEGIYLRPANGRADDQVRRNHTTQYFSHPGYDFEVFRKEAPEKYESYCDIGLNEWIHVKITVENEKARLYVNHSKQPVLIVNDLKLGAQQKGGVGLWIAHGTLGYFKNLKIEME